MKHEFGYLVSRLVTEHRDSKAKRLRLDHEIFNSPTRFTVITIITWIGNITDMGTRVCGHPLNFHDKAPTEL